MCGSGTVLTVALSRGHRAIGLDIDPLAVMMSRVAVTPIDTMELLNAGKRVMSISRRIEGSPAWADDRETSDFVNYWFGQRQRRELVALASAIKAHTQNEIRLALEVAMSRIIVTKSPEASLAADTSHSRPHKVLQSSEYDVLTGFDKSLRQLARRLEQRSKVGGARVLLGDARVLSGVRSSSVDIAVTSPPYLNALDYLRGHKMALVWFGYKISELRARRGTSIGSVRNLESPTSFVTDLVDEIEADAINKSQFKRGMVTRFAQDCVDFSNELARVVKAQGCAVLVVGNSTLRGNYIRNDAIARRAMENAGFSFSGRYEREIPPTMRYMPINAEAGSSITNRMRTEVVLTMDR